MNVLKLIVALVLASALVVFGAQNTQSVAFHFLLWETPSVPVVLAIALGVLAGVLLSWVVSIPGRFAGRRRRRELQHRVDAQPQPQAAAPSEDTDEPPAEDGERSA